MAGYAVECALKACIAKQTQLHDFPDKDRVVKSFTHDIEALALLGGVSTALKSEQAANPIFANHWLVARVWNEKARYSIWSEQRARALFEAVADPTHGVMQWLKLHW